MSYVYNQPYSVTRRPNGPPMSNPPPIPIRRIDDVSLGTITPASLLTVPVFEGRPLFGQKPIVTGVLATVLALAIWYYSQSKRDEK